MQLWTIIKGLLVRETNDKTKRLSFEIDPAATTNTQTTLKSVQTADRTIILPDSSDTLATTTQVNTVQTNLDNHINDPTDAHDASAISNTPAGTISSTDVQAAINELDGDNTSNAAALTAHINDPTDAHDASAISNAPSGNLSATDVQGALNELQTDVDSRIPNAEKGSANGVATLDGAGKVTVSQLPNSVLLYKGLWNANTNTPTLADGVGTAGDIYEVSVAGTQNLGSGPVSYNPGDFIAYSGTIWQKSPGVASAVVSVNGFSGAVVLDTDDISEGTNKYFTDERAQDAVGSILVDTATIDLTYNDGSNQITADVIDDSITNAKLSEVATQTIKGRTTAGTGNPEDLTATQATAILNSFVGDSGSGGTKGLVPAPASGDAAANKFLKANGLWTAFTAGALDSQEFNTDDTFVVPTGVTQLFIVGWGAGGGGGSGCANIGNAAPNYPAGGGGGGAAVPNLVIIPVTPADTLTIDTGTGGTGGTAVTRGAAGTTAGNVGTSGGDTIISIAGPSFTGNRTSGSAIVNGIASTTGLVVGMVATGTGFATGTRIRSVDSGVQVTLSNPATSGSATSTSFTTYTDLAAFKGASGGLAGSVSNNTTAVSGTDTFASAYGSNVAGGGGGGGSAVNVAGIKGADGNRSIYALGGMGAPATTASGLSMGAGSGGGGAGGYGVGGNGGAGATKAQLATTGSSGTKGSGGGGGGACADNGGNPTSGAGGTGGSGGAVFYWFTT